MTIEGGETVLCAGAIGSPQLLMLSGVGPRGHLEQHGIKAVADLPGVGANLRDHPYVPVMFEHDDQAPDYETEPYIQAVLRYTSSASARRNDMQLGHSSLNKAYLPPNKQPRNGSYAFSVFANIQDSRNVGSVRLRSADPSVQPEVRFNYLEDAFDRERLREAVRLIVKLSSQPCFRGRLLDLSLTPMTLQDDEALDAWMCAAIGAAGYHASCSCKMGPAGDPTTVVDQYGRVHGLQDLRVVDASIMPALIRANTNLTTIMLAERVADWMKAA